jgi:hypothetical protein
MTKRQSDRHNKEILKEAINEWLDKKYQQFGKWSLSSLLAIAFGAFIYWILTVLGWHKGIPHV